MLLAIPRVRIGREKWNAFCDSHRGAWFWHRWEWIDYGLALGGGREDLSQGLLRDDRLIGIAPLIREKDRLSFEGEGLPLPLSRGVMGFDDIEIPTVKGAVFRTCPLAAYPEDLSTFTLGWWSCVIDLMQPEGALHAGVRRSYKALINRGLQHYQIFVDASPEIGEIYAALHTVSVGQIAPRPPRTYELQRDWLRDGLAFVVAARGGMAPHGWAAAAYIFTYKDGAYYGSGPSVESDTMHAVLWTAILEAKRRGLKRFEVGWQGRARDEHERGIEHFKAGFGGRDEPVYVMEVTTNAHRVGP